MSMFGKTKVQQRVLFILFCVAISVFQTYYLCVGCRSDTERFILLSAFCFCMWMFLWPGNSVIANLIDKRISWIETPVKRFLFGFISTVIYSVLIILATIKFFEIVFDFYLGSNFMPTVIYSVLITIGFCFFLYGKKFLLNWRKLEIDAVTLRNENLSSRYESLKDQLDPHFLFNSLNVLTNLVYEDPDKSARFIKQLSEVYRYVLDTQGKESVTLLEEMKCVEAYLYLQQIRFGNKLIVHNKLEKMGGRVPPLVIQMLAENAIKHNKISIEHPLTIDIYERDGYVTVENNLQVKEDIHGDSLGIGLENIKKRYAFLSDRPVNIESGVEKFKVDVPLLTVIE